MIKVFSQKINQGSFDIVYDCLINPESNNVGYTHVNEYSNGKQVVSFFVLDFPSLREFFNNGKTNYENINYRFTENGEYFDVLYKKEEQKIILPKNFLLDSYNILEKMWEDD